VNFPPVAISEGKQGRNRPLSGFSSPERQIRRYFLAFLRGQELCLERIYDE
jgi:hypothetical protein